MSTGKDPKDKTDLQRRFLIGSSLALAGTAASGVLTGCGGGNVGTGGSSTGAPASVPPAPAATPAFTPVPGTYSSAQSVTISSATSGSTIYYTADGSMPTTSSTVYGGAIPVNATKTVRAMATASGFQPSSVGTAAYTISATAPPTPVVATPTFLPVAGTYTSAQSVTISCATSGAKIYYTTNGSAPTTSSTAYSGALTVSATETVRAIATASGDQQSNVGSAAYTISAGAPQVVATPTFTPVAGAYTSAQSVTISCATSGATIFYTVDGSTPTTSSSQYGSPLTVSSTQTLKATAIASGATQSAVATASYTISGGALTAPANLQVINQGGPNNGPQGFFSFLGQSNSVSTAADADYQGLSWLPATPGTNPVAKYNVYRNGTLYDSIATPITITGYIVPGKTSSGANCGVLKVTAVSGGKTATADGKILPGLKLTSSASGFASGTIIVEYTTANTGGGGAGTYSVNWSQTCGSSGSPVTFTGWSYNDTLATGCNNFNFLLPGTVYAYTVTAVDTLGNEGPHAYPSAYMYQGISQTQNANFSYGGQVQNFADTTGAPANGPYDVALTFPAGGGGFLPVWSGAGPDTNGCLCPVQRFECGAFNYLAFDIKVTDNAYLTHDIQYIPVLRAYGVSGGVDSAHWVIARVQDYCTPIVNQWVTCKIPFSHLSYGFVNCTGSFAATGKNQGTLTVSSFGAHTALAIDGSGYITGPGIPSGTCVLTTPPTEPPSGSGPWVYSLTGPNIVGTESGSGNYVYQGTGCYKHGWQYGTNVADNTGTFYLNNIGFTTN